MNLVFIFTTMLTIWSIADATCGPVRDCPPKSSIGKNQDHACLITMKPSKNPTYECVEQTVKMKIVCGKKSLDCSEDKLCHWFDVTRADGLAFRHVSCGYGDGIRNLKYWPKSQEQERQEAEAKQIWMIIAAVVAAFPAVVLLAMWIYNFRSKRLIRIRRQELIEIFQYHGIKLEETDSKMLDNLMIWDQEM